MGIPNKTIDTTSLVNILTLRYDPTQIPLLPKYTPSNFANSNEVPNIEKIEKLIIENISSYLVVNKTSYRFNKEYVDKFISKIS